MGHWEEAGADATGALYTLVLGGERVPSYLRMAAFVLLSSSAALEAAVTIPG
jgi:hypothetical protein